MSRNLPISTFARDYATLLEKHPNDEFVLERRAGKEAVILRPLHQVRGDQHAVGALAHVLRHVLDQTEASAAMEAGFEDEFPWVAFLPSEVRSQFTRELLSVLRASAALGRFGAFEDAVDSWRATAEIYADPGLAAQLLEPVELPEGTDVAAPPLPG